MSSPCEAPPGDPQAFEGSEEVLSKLKQIFIHRFVPSEDHEVNRYKFVEFSDEGTHLEKFDSEPLIRYFPKGKIVQLSMRKRESYFSCEDIVEDQGISSSCIFRDENGEIKHKPLRRTVKLKGMTLSDKNSSYIYFQAVLEKNKEESNTVFLVIERYPIISDFEIKDPNNSISECWLSMHSAEIPFSKKDDVWTMETFREPYSPLFMGSLKWTEVKLNITFSSSEVDSEVATYEKEIEVSYIKQFLTSEIMSKIIDSEAPVLSYYNSENYAYYVNGMMGIIPKDNVMQHFS